MRLASSIQQYVFPLLIFVAYSRTPSRMTTRRGLYRATECFRAHPAVCAVDADFFIRSAAPDALPLFHRAHTHWTRFSRRTPSTPYSSAESTGPAATPAPRPTRRRRCLIDRLRTRTHRDAARRSNRCAISSADHGLLVVVATLRRSARCYYADAVTLFAFAECTERTRPRLSDPVAGRYVRAADRCTATEAAVIHVEARSRSLNNCRFCRNTISSTAFAVRVCGRRGSPVDSCSSPKTNACGPASAASTDYSAAFCASPSIVVTNADPPSHPTRFNRR